MTFTQTANATGLDWYALYVRHQNEYKVSSLFSDRVGVEALVPSRKVWRKKGSKKEVYLKPILASYVFIKANLNEIEWPLFWSVDGIVGFVRQQGSPAPVDETQLDGLVNLGLSELPIHEMEYKKLKPNDQVEVISGPLKGAIGHYKHVDKESGLFIVSVDLFQRSLTTGIEAKFVRPY